MYISLEAILGYACWLISVVVGFAEAKMAPAVADLKAMTDAFEGIDKLAEGAPRTDGAPNFRRVKITPVLMSVWDSVSCYVGLKFDILWVLVSRKVTHQSLKNVEGCRFGGGPVKNSVEPLRCKVGNLENVLHVTDWPPVMDWSHAEFDTLCPLNLKTFWKKCILSESQFARLETSRK